MFLILPKNLRYFVTTIFILISNLSKRACTFNARGSQPFVKPVPIIKQKMSAYHQMSITFFCAPWLKEWWWTAQNSIARQSFARHFWQQINCSTQNLSTAQIQLILAQLDSSRWQKKWQMVDTVKQLTLLSSATYKLKKSIFYL